MGDNLELISLNIWHIIATIANLLILFFILKKFLWKPVKKVMAERQGQVDEIYKNAEESAAIAERDKQLYAEKLNNAQAEAENIIKTAAVRADRISDGIIADAKEKADQTLKKAESDIELEKKKAMNDLKNEISGISMEIAKNVIGREINEKDHKDLIDSFIENIGSGESL